MGRGVRRRWVDRVWWEVPERRVCEGRVASARGEAEGNEGDGAWHGLRAWALVVVEMLGGV